MQANTSKIDGWIDRKADKDVRKYMTCITPTLHQVHGLELQGARVPPLCHLSPYYYSGVQGSQAHLKIFPFSSLLLPNLLV